VLKLQGLRGFFAVMAMSLLCTAEAQIKSSGPYLPPQYVDGIMAVVGGKIILQSDFETEKMQMTKGATLKDSQSMHCRLLEDMIVQKLLLNQAELDSLVVPEDQLESEIDNRLRYWPNWRNIWAKPLSNSKTISVRKCANSCWPNRCMVKSPKTSEYRPRR
jgi:hypothetical protein